MNQLTQFDSFAWFAVFRFSQTAADKLSQSLSVERKKEKKRKNYVDVDVRGP